MVFDEVRTATVRSTNYCTMATLDRQSFFELCTNFPEIFAKMKETGLKYDDNDVWKSFKVLLLKQIDYMSPTSNVFLDDAFYAEIQFYMKEECFPKGHIISA